MNHATINSPSATFNISAACAPAPALVTQDLEEEYTSFFDNFASERYLPNVEFIDPLTSFTGFQKYKNNVDMLGGRSALGNILFKVYGYQNTETYSSLYPVLKKRYQPGFIFKGSRTSKNRLFHSRFTTKVHGDRETVLLSSLPRMSQNRVFHPRFTDVILLNDVVFKIHGQRKTMYSCRYTKSNSDIIYTVHMDRKRDRFRGTRICRA